MQIYKPEWSALLINPLIHKETVCDSLVARSELHKRRRLETQTNFVTNAVLPTTANVQFLFFLSVFKRYFLEGRMY
jgi:hypothetical protein